MNHFLVSFHLEEKYDLFILTEGVQSADTGDVSGVPALFNPASLSRSLFSSIL